MKKINLLKMGFLCLSVATLDSCVTSKKFDALMAKKVRLEGDYAECQDSLEANKKGLMLQKKSFAQSDEDNKKLKLDSAQMGYSYRKTKKLYDEQVEISDRLRRDYKELLSNCSTESSKLSNNLLKKENDLLALEKTLQDSKKQNEKLSNELKDREQKVKQLEEVLKNKDKAVQELKNKLSNALLSFKDKDLTINIKNGKVYVSLSEQLLFKSGSTEVDKKGVEALKKLSEVLKAQDDINVVVEGHTDDVPMKGAVIKDNWDLSVIRATEIVRILTNEGVQGTKLTASGRGEYLPITEGKTPEIRQKNRRTEIIITPKLDELFKILESN